MVVPLSCVFVFVLDRVGDGLVVVVRIGIPVGGVDRETDPDETEPVHSTGLRVVVVVPGAGLPLLAVLVVYSAHGGGVVGLVVVATAGQLVGQGTGGVEVLV